MTLYFAIFFLSSSFSFCKSAFNLIISWMLIYNPCYSIFLESFTFAVLFPTSLLKFLFVSLYSAFWSFICSSISISASASFVLSSLYCFLLFSVIFANSVSNFSLSCWERLLIMSFVLRASADFFCLFCMLSIWVCI